ncbi:hypothetical protein X773_28130 [Mesorhizobium sp. LSJC285A00]|nr:hypothetical protein X773_28130 [Mesorhizobium sp. LSJC285A00]
MGYPALLTQETFHADLADDRGDHPRVVGLHAADGDKLIGI